MPSQLRHGDLIVLIDWCDLQEIGRLGGELDEMSQKYHVTVERMNRLHGIREQLYHDLEVDIMAKYFEGFAPTALWYGIDVVVCISVRVSEGDDCV